MWRSSKLTNSDRWYFVEVEVGINMSKTAHIRKYPAGFLQSTASIFAPQKLKYSHEKQIALKKKCVIASCWAVRPPDCWLCCWREPAETVYQRLSTIQPEVGAIIHPHAETWVCATSTGTANVGLAAFCPLFLTEVVCFWGLTARLCVGERGHRDREWSSASNSDGRGETITPSLIRPFSHIPTSHGNWLLPPTANWNGSADQLCWCRCSLPVVAPDTNSLGMLSLVIST